MMPSELQRGFKVRNSPPTSICSVIILELKKHSMVLMNEVKVVKILYFNLGGKTQVNRVK